MDIVIIVTKFKFLTLQLIIKTIECLGEGEARGEGLGDGRGEGRGEDLGDAPNLLVDPEIDR